jgi:ferredoxin
VSAPDAPWTIAIDRDRCMGSGNCVTYAPGTFDNDEEARAIIRVPSTDTLDEIRSAVESCPTGAIALTIHESERNN